MSVDLVQADLEKVLRMTSELDIAAEPSTSLRLLQHFQATTSLTMGSTTCKGVMHNFVAMKAWHHPHLMHIVMAVSSAHLKRLYADQLQKFQQFSITEAAHWQTGLKLYRESISGPPKHDFDATIATTFLTIMFTFALDDEVPLDAYGGEDEQKFQNALNPLAATGGFRAMRSIFGEFMNTSIWKIVLSDSDDDKGTFSNSEEAGVNGLPPALVDLCELNERSTAENSEYHHIARLLTPLLKIDFSDDNFTKLIAFAGRTWPSFQPLILRRDPRGLLLLSYWFALLSQVDQW